MFREFNVLRFLEGIAMFRGFNVITFSTGYLPFRPGLVSGDRCSEKLPKNGSSRGARVFKKRVFWIKILEGICYLLNVTF